MHDGKPKAVVTPMLERVLDAAQDGSAAAVFAHRHLAEYRIEDHPWRALLHLRRITAAGKADDAVHALGGLAHALLGNYLAAVAEYKKAVRFEPKNPWYRHNLGHLLDVALDRPQEALKHLETAAAGAAGDAEIAASLAHCLARVGQRARAETIAEGAAQASPGSVDHEDLLRWIRTGKTEPLGDIQPPKGLVSVPVEQAARARTAPGDVVAAQEATDEVVRLLEVGMKADGFTAEQLERALELYGHYRKHAETRPASSKAKLKPAVVAAALQYALGRIDRVRGMTYVAVARRYGVTSKAVSDRLIEVSNALALEVP